MDKYEILLFCAILTFVALITCCLLSYKKPAEAEPVTTEVPVYIAKCTEREFTLNTCIEFTIYRITRN